MAIGPSIRLAVMSDASALAQLGRATFTEKFGFLYKPEDLEAFFKKGHSEDIYAGILTDPASQIWVVETATNELVGFTVAGPCDLPLPDRPDNAGELQRFYLLGAHQGAGLGSQMLTLALDWLESRFEHIYLSVFYANHGAQRLYKRFGFETVHEYHYMVGNQADPEYIMKRTS